jgi:hypothetical protein
MLGYTYKDKQDKESKGKKMNVFRNEKAKAEFQARWESNLAKRQAAMDALNAKKNK